MIKKNAIIVCIFIITMSLIGCGSRNSDNKMDYNIESTEHEQIQATEDELQQQFIKKHNATYFELYDMYSAEIEDTYGTERIYYLDNCEILDVVYNNDNLCVLLYPLYIDNCTLQLTINDEQYQYIKSQKDDYFADYIVAFCFNKVTPCSPIIETNVYVDSDNIEYPHVYNSFKLTGRIITGETIEIVNTNIEE